VGKSAVYEGPRIGHVTVRPYAAREDVEVLWAVVGGVPVTMDDSVRGLEGSDGGESAERLSHEGRRSGEGTLPVAVQVNYWLAA